MKKIGLICLALILALGTLGVGYAMWKDTVVINGTVETGTVRLGISKASCDEPWDEYLDKNVGNVTCTQSGELLCMIFYALDETPVYERAEFIISNAYPGYRPTVWVDVASCGTIPTHLTDITLTMEQVDAGGTHIKWLTWDWDGDGLEEQNPWGIFWDGPVDTGIPVMTVAVTNIVCTQLHWGDYIEMEIDFGFPSNEMPQKAIYLVTITVEGEQWAESAGP